MKILYTVITVFSLGLSQPYAYAESIQEAPSASPENMPTKQPAKKRFDEIDMKWGVPGLGLVYAGWKCIHRAMASVPEKEDYTRDLSLLLKNRIFWLGASCWAAGMYCGYKSQTPEYWQERDKEGIAAVKKVFGTIAGGVGLTAGGALFVQGIRGSGNVMIPACAFGLYAMLGGYHILEKTWKPTPLETAKE